MWKNDLTKLLGVKYPIVQGPFGGGFSSVDLVVTVCNAGGVGSFGANVLSPEEITRTIADIRSRTTCPFNINLWVSNCDEEVNDFDESQYDHLVTLFQPYFDELGIEIPPRPIHAGEHFDEQIQALLLSAPPIFSFVYGIPSADILAECRSRNIVTIGTATTVEEAVALEKAGVSAIVASGFEAGGHRVSFLRSPEQSLTGLFSLIPQVVDHVAVPVIAAGGIADARGIVAAMTLGAQGVQIGTGFLACKESNAPDEHKQKILNGEVQRTTLTKAFSGRLARGFVSRITHDMEQQEVKFAPYPLQGRFINALKNEAIRQNRFDLLTLWAGQSTSLLRHRDASTLLQSLVVDAEALWCTRE